MKNHFEGATPEQLAKALMKPDRKTKKERPRRVIRHESSSIRASARAEK